jgi:hypothetical protein
MKSHKALPELRGKLCSFVVERLLCFASREATTSFIVASGRCLHAQEKQLRPLAQLFGTKSAEGRFEDSQEEVCRAQEKTDRGG